MAKLILVLYFLNFLVIKDGIAVNQIKGLDDSILFRLNWAGQDHSLLKSPDYEKLLMITSNNEEYQCLVPIHYGFDGDEIDNYNGPNALRILMPLFKKYSCNIRLESYWTYELCHGLHIKQFHEEREGKTSRTHEYTLGKISVEELEKQAIHLDEQLKINPKPIIHTTKIEGNNMPYFMVNYTDGTKCDLTEISRQTHILFVCYDEGRHDIYSIKETYTCEYEIVILSPLLCQHPAYRPRDLPQTDLHCISMNKGPKRPRRLVQYEAESLKFRSSSTILSSDASGDSVKLEIIDSEELDSAAAAIFAAVKKSAPEGNKKSSQFPLHSTSDEKVIEEFLSGEFCLHGGSGWWKFEFCYGRKVEQYHELIDGSRQVIILGIFNAKNHGDWIAENPEKKYKMGRRYVSHFYTEGSFCESTGKPRHVEVKLKCKESASPSAVSLYLLEPRTCEYILGVETSIVCPLLENANDQGLFVLPANTDAFFSGEAILLTNDEVNNDGVEVISEEDMIIKDKSENKEDDPGIEAPKLMDQGQN